MLRDMQITDIYTSKRTEPLSFYLKYHFKFHFIRKCPVLFHPLFSSRHISQKFSRHARDWHCLKPYMSRSGGDMDDMFGDIFGNMFHGGSASGRSRRTSGFTGGFGGESFRSKGSDIKAGITVGFDEAAFGGDKVITLSNPENPGQPGQSLKVHIPAGIDNGKSIRLRGKGMPGTGGGEAGDLLLKVTVAPKPGYERKGMDVYTTVSVPYTTAVFGGEALVHTLYGDVMCKIKEGTQSGSKIRLRGKGIVSMKDSSVHGDQYVTIQIEVPRNLSPQARQKLKEFEEICQGSSRTA